MVFTTAFLSGISLLHTFVNDSFWYRSRGLLRVFHPVGVEITVFLLLKDHSPKDTGNSRFWSLHRQRGSVLHWVIFTSITLTERWLPHAVAKVSSSAKSLHTFMAIEFLFYFSRKAYAPQYRCLSSILPGSGFPVQVELWSLVLLVLQHVAIDVSVFINVRSEQSMLCVPVEHRLLLSTAPSFTPFTIAYKYEHSRTEVSRPGSFVVRVNCPHKPHLLIIAQAAHHPPIRFSILFSEACLCKFRHSGSHPGH